MDRNIAEPPTRFFTDYHLGYYMQQPPPMLPDMESRISEQLWYLGYPETHPLQLYWQNFYWLLKEQQNRHCQSQLRTTGNAVMKNPVPTNQENAIEQPKMFACDWPECIRCFPTEEILKHHRRFHIRKSKYLCENCSRRLLNRQEYQEHVVLCKNNAVVVQNENREPMAAAKATATTTTTAGPRVPDCKNKIPQLLSETDRYWLIQQLISSPPANNRSGDGGQAWTKRDLKTWLAIDTKNEPTNRHGDSGQTSPDADYKRTRYSGIGRYQCPWPGCTYTPHFLRDLRRHMFKHTGDKKYKCPHCRFVSVWKTSLLQHQRKKH